jgi:hypothetical protein
MQRLDKKIIDELRAEDLWEYFIENEKLPDAEQKLIIDVLSKPYRITVIDGDLSYKDDSGEWCKMPDTESGVRSCSLFLSEYLPNPWFKTNVHGSMAKSSEAEAMYYTGMVCGCLQSTMFYNDFKDIISNYDFVNYCSKDIDGIGFRDFLLKLQDLQSFKINCIISSAKYKLSLQKKETEKFLKDGLEVETIIELDLLADEIFAVNQKYSGKGGQLSTKVVSDLTKIQILQAIKDRDGEISKLVLKSSVGSLYRAFNLSSEYIEAEKKEEIKRAVAIKVEKYFDGSYESNFEDRSAYESKLRQRCIKIERTSVRKTELSKYIKDPAAYVTPKKK